MKGSKWRVLVLFGIFTSLHVESIRAQDADYPTYLEESLGIPGYDDFEATGSPSLDMYPDDDVLADAEKERMAEITTEIDSGKSSRRKQRSRASAHRMSDIDREERPMWKLGAQRYHNSWSGSTGLMDITQAGSGPVGTLGLGLFAGFFKYRDYLILGDENAYMTGNLNIRLTPLRFLEFHASIMAMANQNTRETPSLFQTLGDSDVGAKGFWSPTELLTLGLDFGLRFANSVGDVGVDFSGTSVGFDALATVDFSELSTQTPLRLHLMMGYLFDNTSNLIRDIERDNGGCGTDIGDGRIEHRGCISPVERTALGINRVDQFRIGIGLDALLPYVSPILEYRMDIPVNRQQFICPRVSGSYDTCLADRGLASMRSWLNIGFRILPPISNLAVDLGLEIGVTGYAPTVHELVAQEPYLVKMGLTYQFNPGRPGRSETSRITTASDQEPRQSMPAPTSAVTIPETVIITGMIHDDQSPDSAVENAIVIYEGLDLNPQLATQSGRFNSYPLPTGNLQIRIQAPNYEEKEFPLSMDTSGVYPYHFAMTALPQKGVLAIVVSNLKGTPLSGVEVVLDGILAGTYTTDQEGKITLESKPGNIAITIADERFLAASSRATVSAESVARVDLSLTDVPKSGSELATLSTRRITIRRNVVFVSNAAEINPSSFGLLDEVASLLLQNPHVKRVEIQGHTDDRGLRKQNMALSQARADSVKTYLVEKGVPADRLETRGLGPDRPVAPNITSTGRARNRRVEFHIREQE